MPSGMMSGPMITRAVGRRNPGRLYRRMVHTKPDLHPLFYGQGAVAASTVGISVAWPAGHDTDDIGLIVLETANEDLVSIPAGWEHAPGSPVGTGVAGTAGSVKLIVLWRRATSNAEPSVAIADVGNHVIGRMYGIRYACQVGSPFDAEWSALIQSTSNTIHFVATFNIWVSNCLYIGILANATNVSTNEATDVTNTSLWNFNWNTFNSATGNGGGATFVTAWLIADTGATNPTQITHVTSTKAARIGFAIKPRVSIANVQSLTSTITPAGSLIKQAQKSLTSTLTPAGVLLKQIQKVFTGSVTPAGTLTINMIVIKVFTSTITAAGTLIKQIQKPLTGSVTPAGTLIKQISKTFTSSVTPAGTLAKQVQKTFTGSITAAGTLVRQVNKALTSSVTAAGTLIKQVNKTLASSITPAGTLRKQPQKTLTGSVTPAGTLVKQINKALTGSLTPAGTLIKYISKMLTSTVTPSGVIRKQINKTFTSVIQATGSLTTHTIVGIIVTAARYLYARLRLRSFKTEPNTLAAPLRSRTIEVDLTMTTLQQYPDKGTAEQLSYIMDFVNELALGETLNSPAVVVTVSTDSLVADATPQNLYVAASAQAQGSKVGFQLHNGTNGCLYVIQVQVSTSNAQTLEARALVLVNNATE
jgi:hypothetical protein